MRLLKTFVETLKNTNEIIKNGRQNFDKIIDNRG